MCGKFSDGVFDPLLPSHLRIKCVIARQSIPFAASADEREGAVNLLDNSRRLCVLGDKGFLDHRRQAIPH